MHFDFFWEEKLLLSLFYRNAFGNAVCTVALNLGTVSVVIRSFLNNLDGFGVGIKLGLHVGEAVDAGDDEGGILAQTVQNNAEGLYADLIGVQCDFDCAFCGSKGPEFFANCVGGTPTYSLNCLLKK